MTSSGSNTWSIPLELNNLESQITHGGGGGGVQTVSAGTNITITGTTTNPIINSSASGGVISLTAGSGLSVSSSTGAITVGNTGVLSITAGAGISLTGTTQNPSISALGVQSVSAGTNTTITGTATNPIINLNPSQLPAGVSLDIANTNYTIPVSQLANAYIYSSKVLTAPRTLLFPNYASLVAQYGNNAVIPFTMGAFKQFAPENFINIEVANDTDPNECFIHCNINPDGTWNGITPALPSQDGYVLPPCIFDGKVILDSDVGGRFPSQNQKAYITFNFRTQYIPTT
jgi:hypothetical protein